MKVVVERYHGLGNDYLVFDPNHNELKLDEANVKMLCDRNEGLGADGVLEGPILKEDGMHVKVWNPDGSESETSGNGVRIFAKYLKDASYVQKKNFKLYTGNGPVEVTFLNEDGSRLRVSMGKLSFWSDEIPVIGERREVINEDMVFGRTLYPVTCVSIGNPHCVIPMREISKPLVCKIGDYSEIARYFPNRINTQIMQVIDKENIAIEIFERGAGYTRASGTGACAAAGQAKAKYPDSLRKELLQEYMEALRKYQPIDESYFYSQLRHFVLFRTLQVLGAYGFRGYFEKKPHFIQSVPYAIENLRELLKEEYPEYPYLCNVLRELTGLKQFTDDLKKRQLTVKVMSFAYKKGIPDDSTGNGGGYVFDCRAVNNPGKYERYKPFTGLDEPVITFLEEDGEILGFLDHVYALVDASVKRYMERGFSNLSVCFGCTGGQHRSVYSAQHLAEHLNQKFGVKVKLVHREQNIEHTFEATI